MESKIEDGILKKVSPKDMMDGLFYNPDVINNVNSDAFDACYSLTEINLPRAEKLMSFALNNLKINLTTLILPELKLVCAEDFKGCVNLSTVLMPQVKEIWWGAFENCISLNNISFPQLEKVEYEIFKGCTSLVYVNLPKATKVWSQAFYNCINLNTITFSQQIHIHPSSFQLCSNLKNLIINNTADVDVHKIHKQLPSDLNGINIILQSEMIKKFFIIQEVLNQNVMKDIHHPISSLLSRLGFFATDIISVKDKTMPTDEVNSILLS